MNREERNFETFNHQMHTLLAISEKMQNSREFTNITALSHTALSVLMCIPRWEGRNFKDITKTLNLPKSTLTGVARQLENQGYVIRRCNESDRRIQDLFLTEKGMATQEEHDLCEKKIYEVLTNHLTMEEKEILISLIGKSINHQSDKE